MTAGFVLLGAFIAVTGLVSLDSAIVAMRELVPAYRTQHLEANGRALRAGAVAVHDGGHILTKGYPRINRTLTMEALPHLLNGLSALGLRAVSIPELLALSEDRD